MKTLLGALAILGVVSGAVWGDVTQSRPSSYDLTDVVFEYQRSGAWVDDTQITVSGKGEGRRVEAGNTDRPIVTTFVVEPNEVFELLELCYREHFFDLSESYDDVEFPKLGPAGRIEALGAHASDISGERVTLRVGTFSKSVSYLQSFSNPPGIVQTLVKRINDISSRPVAK